MNTLTTLDFNGTAVPVIAHDNDVWMDSETVGRALGYDNPRRSVVNLFNRNREELEPFSTVTSLVTVDGKNRETRVYNEEGVMMLCFFSSQPLAKYFRRWAVGILKAYRHGTLAALPPADCVIKEVAVGAYRGRATKHTLQSPQGDINLTVFAEWFDYNG